MNYIVDQEFFAFESITLHTSYLRNVASSGTTDVNCKAAALRNTGEK